MRQQEPRFRKVPKKNKPEENEYGYGKAFRPGIFVISIALALTTLSLSLVESSSSHMRRLQTRENNQAGNKEQVSVTGHDGRPIMHTFFEPAWKNHANLLAELDNWKKAWSDAGWDPIVLTLADARRHPDFQKFEDAFAKAEHQLHDYDRMCFYRWLAMASSGGGWMSDYDTFPLNTKSNQDGITLPNEGKFTCYSNWVPSLVSGSESEWERMTQLLLYSYKMHTNEFWSDMYALLELHNYLDNFISVDDSISIQNFYQDELKKKKSDRPLIEHPYALSPRCKYAEGKRVVHFSHSNCRAVEFCHERRDLAVPLWLAAFDEKCDKRR